MRFISAICAVQVFFSGFLLAETPKQTVDIFGNNFYSVGDMRFVVEEGDDLLAVPKRRASLWPAGVVPVDFESYVNSSDQADILSACNEWGKHSRVSCVKRTNERDHIFVVFGTGSSSYVGRIRGPQTLTIGRVSHGARADAGRWTVVHEFGHALGFRHQHTSPDRDRFLTINYDQIDEPDDKKLEANFGKEASDRRIGPYDYESVMHYGQCAFAKNEAACGSAPTPNQYTVISTKDPSKQSVIGQRSKLSRGDKLGVAFLYGQDANDTLIAEVPDFVNLYRQPFFYNTQYSLPEFGVRTRVVKGGNSHGQWQGAACELIIFSHDVVKQSIAAGTKVAINTVVELETELYRRVISVPPKDGESCP